VHHESTPSEHQNSRFTATRVDRTLVQLLFLILCFRDPEPSNLVL